MPHFHVSSCRNRESILAHGLDWQRMGAAPGIAGSPGPELEGCFLARDRAEADWFVQINNTGGPVDVWEVVGIDPELLLESDEGYEVLLATVPAACLLLVSTDLPVARPDAPGRRSPSGTRRA